jgi:hypothetical protein
MIVGEFKEQLTFRKIKGLQQPLGTNLCGFYSASSSGGTPVSGEHVPRTLMYINDIHSFLLLSSIVLSFIQFIYIHIDLLKVVSDAGEAPTNPAHKSN